MNVTNHSIGAKEEGVYSIYIVLIKENTPWKVLWVLGTVEGVMDVRWHSIDAMEEELY